MRITTEQAIQAHEQGLISRTTLWRAQKRGWCEIDYHKKSVGTATYTEEEIKQLNKSAFVKALRYCKAFMIWKYIPNIDTVAMDLQQEALLHIWETKPPYLQAFSKMEMKIREQAQRNKMYSKYFIFADNKSHLGAREKTDSFCSYEE